MKPAHLLLCIIFFLIVTIRIVLASFQPYAFNNNQVINITTRVMAEPVIQGKHQRLSISIANERVQITTATFPRYHYDDQVNVRGKITVASATSGRKYASLMFPKITLLPESNPLSSATTFIRNHAAATFERVLPPVHAGLLLGIVFGLKRNLPDSLKEDLQIAGLMHVIAASGMNVSLVAGALYAMLGRWMHRKTAILLSLTGVWFYALIAGMQASIVRASIMGSLALISQFFGRQYTGTYVLFLTAGIMLLTNPHLMTDIGFQLSFLATAGIIVVKPRLGILTKGKTGALIGEDITTTLAAQVTTLPVLLANFGTVNFLSFLSNVLVLWTIPVLMILGSIAVLAGLFHPLIASISLYIAIPLLWYFTAVTSLSSSIPWTIRLTDLPFSAVAGYYILLIGGLMMKKPQKNLTVTSERESVV